MHAEQCLHMLYASVVMFSNYDFDSLAIDDIN